MVIEGAVVRLSRGAGPPAPLPDLLGLAIRLPSAGSAPVDLLLTTTGRGPLGRLLPALRRDTAAVHSSIMGYRSDAGTLRKEFGTSIGNNATHGSDAPETAAFELGYFFPGLDLA